jgi:glyoxylase-like metal-dependent hydrolase (beta-lactamase superfamily II)
MRTLITLIAAAGFASTTFAQQPATSPAPGPENEKSAVQSGGRTNEAVTHTTSPSVAGARDFTKVQSQTTKLADGLYVLIWSGTVVGNMGVSVGDDGVLLIDDGFPQLADKVKSAVAELSPRPIRIVLNTNWHFDHADGTEWLAEAGAIVIAPERSRARMLSEQSVPEFSGQVIPPYRKAALPVVTCGESLSLHFNGDEIRAMHVPNAHSDGDLLFQFVKANVLQTGDLFFPKAIPFIHFTGGGSIEGMIRAADRILELCDANTRIIPGHGPVSNRDDVRAYRELLVTIRDRLMQAIETGKTVDEVVAANPLADLYPKGRRSYFKPEDLTRYGYLDLKRSRESRR